MPAKLDDAPTRCNEKIAVSTLGHEWAMFEAIAEYTVQPVPAPSSTYEEEIKRKNGGGEVKCLCYLDEEMLYLDPPILMEEVNFQIPQLWLVLL